MTLICDVNMIAIVYFSVIFFLQLELCYCSHTFPLAVPLQRSLAYFGSQTNVWNLTHIQAQ